MAIHRRNIALTRGIGILPMGYWLEANTTWRFTEWNWREARDIDGKPEGRVCWRKRIEHPTIRTCLS
jgi:hypothetical protein